MKLFAPVSYTSPCFVHRLVYPFRHLSKDYPQHEWEAGLADPTGDYDALFVYGAQPLSNFPEFGSLKRKGIKLVWCCDDPYWDWPIWRHDKPSKEVVGCVDLMSDLADLIVASTDDLSEQIGKQRKTVVAPNLIDVSSYRLQTPPTDDEVIRICWSGSATHKWDLNILDDACCRVKEKWQEKVEFFLYGAGPDKLLRDWWGRGVHLTEWVPLNEYTWRLNKTQPHIQLCPLTDCSFNRSKSAIRVLEAWSLNAAVVASPVGEYCLGRRPVDCLFADTPDQWFDRMDELIRDRALRESLAGAGYKRVREEWDWNSESARQKWSPVIDVLDGWEKCRVIA